ncbi:response regulator [Clostridium magnum]|uniref:Stage 0 sporulation protein A homolog n=1 Tax=Clostridium magnum DSM 2767 TaxID=1121326 RepID=A0A162SJ20_9CLOT|nr:response regulator [Clostridium magnum]KZL91339.1 chemotaxis protein CheY [Clostridium magnum DSM 2767]SHH38558.1 Response regulator receiver domain-containing protein [Clostridium magnum DSM 2767]
MIKILIVDDSSFSQRITANLIRKFLSDVDLYFANDGQEGLEAYKSINPDYTFVDLLMPKISGKEMIEFIKKFENDAKIIVVSADVQKSVREDMEVLGIMSFINKPFNEDKAKIICDMIRNDLK